MRSIIVYGQAVFLPFSQAGYSYLWLERQLCVDELRSVWPFSSRVTYSLLGRDGITDSERERERQLLTCRISLEVFAGQQAYFEGVS